MSCSVGAENLYRDPPSIAIVTLLPFSPTTPFLERKKRDNEMKKTIPGTGAACAGAMQVRARKCARRREEVFFLEGNNPTVPVNEPRGARFMERVEISGSSISSPRPSSFFHPPIRHYYTSEKLPLP